MRIHIFSNSPHVNSGYSRVVTNLAVELKKLGHDIAITGMQTAYKIDYYNGLPVYPLIPDYQNVNIPAQMNRLALNLKRHGSEVLLCLFQGDANYNQYTQIFPKTVWYVPIEGKIIYKNHPLFRDARKVSKVVSMTHSAGIQLANHGIMNTTIYHGYDPRIFRKGYESGLTEEILMYFPKTHEELSVPAHVLSEMKSNIGSECIFGFVGQNFGVRKRIERLIEAFSIFAKDKKDVHLHLHTNPRGGINLLEVCDYFDIKDQVSLSYGDIISSGWSEQALNLLYNMFDVHASASSGEGFGLSHLESMAGCVPQIAPDVEPFREFFGIQNSSSSEMAEIGRGLVAKSTPQLTSAGELRGLVDTQSLAEKMELMYSDSVLRNTMGTNAQDWAKQYEWPAIAKKFEKVFRSM